MRKNSQSSAPAAVIYKAWLGDEVAGTGNKAIGACTCVATAKTYRLMLLCGSVSFQSFLLAISSSQLGCIGSTCSFSDACFEIVRQTHRRHMKAVLY